MSTRKVFWQGAHTFVPPMEAYKMFLATKPTEEQFTKFLLRGINFYFLIREDVPDHLQHVYNNVQRMLADKSRSV
jgi:hypothetical protein